jgi:hypothetical protein
MPPFWCSCLHPIIVPIKRALVFKIKKLNNNLSACINRERSHRHQGNHSSLINSSWNYGGSHQIGHHWKVSNGGKGSSCIEDNLKDSASWNYRLEDSTIGC